MSNRQSTELGLRKFGYYFWTFPILQFLQLKKIEIMILHLFIKRTALKSIDNKHHIKVRYDY